MDQKAKIQGEDSERIIDLKLSQFYKVCGDQYWLHTPLAKEKSTISKDALYLAIIVIIF